MRDCLLENRPDDSIPVVPVAEDAFSSWLEVQSKDLKRWIEATDFTAKPGSVCLVPDGQGGLRSVVAGITDPDETGFQH